MDLSADLSKVLESSKMLELSQMEPEPMEVENAYDAKIAQDGTKIFPLGKDVFVGVQWFNNGLSYIIRVSQVDYIPTDNICNGMI